MITFENVAKKFPDGTYGVVDINLEIPNGDFIFIVGQSGAGKTTLLKLLTGQLRPTTGTIMIDDMNVGKIKPNNLYKLRRTIGVVFQDFKLLPDQTVYENVALALEVIGQHEKKYKQTVFDLLQKVGLAGKENYFPVQLSGGELQRIAIARAFVSNPKMLIADEPTGDLDPKTAWEILKLLDEINKTGTTILMATHNHTIVDAMKKRVITVDHGRISSDIKAGMYDAPKAHKHEELKEEEVVPLEETKEEHA